jgi:hypothetical protein
MRLSQILRRAFISDWMLEGILYLVIFVSNSRLIYGLDYIGLHQKQWEGGHISLVKL